MFELKTWLDRVCQIPARRMLPPTGSDGEYDDSLADGEVMVEGDTTCTQAAIVVYAES